MTVGRFVRRTGGRGYIGDPRRESLPVAESRPLEGDRGRVAGAACYTPSCFLSVPRRRPGPRVRRQRGSSHWKECPGACADTNSCSSSDPMSRTIGPRRSSTARPAASSPPAAQIVKVAPWGRRRLAYPIDRYREGSYHIILFEAPVRRHRRAGAHAAHHRGGPSPPRDPRRAPGPARAPRRGRGREAKTSRTRDLPSGRGRGGGADDTERIDESESEAAPAAID